MEAPSPPPLIVLDTLVVISALIGSESASSYRLVQAIATGEARLAVSDESLRELSRVVGYPEVENKIISSARAFHVALDLGLAADTYHPTRYDWPSIDDPKDGWMLDLAWASTADYIVTRDPHLMEATLPFPIDILTPPQLLERLPPQPFTTR